MDTAYRVIRGAVPYAAVDSALRRINVEVLQYGLPPKWAKLDDWIREACWFPHMRWDPAFVGLATHVPAQYQVGDLCEPQILLQYPHVGEPGQLVPHQDAPPPWAVGRKYSHICGVALTQCMRMNGGPVVWPGNPARARPLAMLLAPGDIFVMRGDCWHSGGYNMTGSVRYMVYLRWLALPPQ